MTHAQTPLVRLAVAMHAQLEASRQTVRVAELPAERWRRCESLVGNVRRAELRGWRLAAEQLRHDLRCALRSLEMELEGLTDRLDAAPKAAPLNSVGDVYRDIVALETEFEEIRSDLRARTLAVITESIELENVLLGPFEIRLDWKHLAAEPCYRVVALEPNPAATRDDVTHPHVLDEVLCEGHGRQAIRQALAQGRLLDFFTLVAHVLRTYNPESPFVELASWDGRACRDCGAVVDEDERFVCQQCGADVCDECYVNCAGCGDAHCAGCLTPCAVCDDGCCRWCLRACAGCRAWVCQPCLNQQERCSRCHEEEPEETSEAVEQPRPAVHADRLGQTAVPT
jgi:hypothetical protein